MTARFPSMIGIMRNAIKTGVQSCSVPANALCFRILNLLRENGLIFGFSHHYTRRRLRHGFYHGYPRVTITFKYADSNSPVIKDLKVFKNTRSNFYLFKSANKNFQVLAHHNLYVLSNSNGLILTSLADLYSQTLSSNKKPLNGKILLELSL
jgi:ribosomal protein S8